MQSIKQITIPQPCHQSWDQMTPVEQGRYCQSCCKTVVDFTTMGNADVIAYFSSHKNVCGRIGLNKLAAINYELEVKSRKRFSWKGLLAVASLSVLFPVVRAEAQTAKVQHVRTSKFAPKDSSVPDRSGERLSARMTEKLDTTAVLANDAVVSVNVDIQYKPIEVTLGGMVAGVQINPVPVYERWWDELFRIF